jgi:hypothetical protein
LAECDTVEEGKDGKNDEAMHFVYVRVKSGAVVVSSTREKWEK